MYQIILNDHNCVEGYQGESAFFFAEDIDDFEKRWVALGAEEASLERFRKSKSGELISDTWFDDSKDNIVNKFDEAKTIGERCFEITDTEFHVSNSTEGRMDFRVDNWKLQYRWIQLDNNYFRIARYRAEGVQCKRFHDTEWIIPVRNGNPVIELEDNDSGCSLTTICYLLSCVLYNEEEAIKDMDSFNVESYRGEKENLFVDVVGNMIEPQDW